MSTPQTCELGWLRLSKQYFVPYWPKSRGGQKNFLLASLAEFVPHFQNVAPPMSVRKKKNFPKIFIGNILISCVTQLFPSPALQSVKLDSLWWFSQRRSPTPHFQGCASGGYVPQIRIRSRFLRNAPMPPSFIILCLLVWKLWCWQTNKQTNKLADATHC